VTGEESPGILVDSSGKKVIRREKELLKNLERKKHSSGGVGKIRESGKNLERRRQEQLSKPHSIKSDRKKYSS